MFDLHREMGEPTTRLWTRDLLLLFGGDLEDWNGRRDEVRGVATPIHIVSPRALRKPINWRLSSTLCPPPPFCWMLKIFSPWRCPFCRNPITVVRRLLITDGGNVERNDCCGTMLSLKVTPASSSDGVEWEELVERRQVSRVHKRLFPPYIFIQLYLFGG